MLQYLINVTYTMLPATMLVALLSGMINNRKDFLLRNYLAGGMLLGTSSAVVLAVLRLTTGFVIRELYNAPLLLLMVVAEAVLLVWLFSPRKNSFFHTERFASSLVFVLAFVWFAFALPDMVLYPFEFDVGMDTLYNQAFLNRIMGYLVGLAAAGLMAWSFYCLSVRHGEKLFKQIFIIVTAISAAWHVLLFLQIAVLRRWVPDASWLVDMVMCSLAYQRVFLFALLILAAYASVGSIRISRKTVIDGPNPAIQRKQKMDVKRQIRQAVLLLLTVTAVLLVQTVGVALDNQTVELSPPVELAPDAGEIAIPVEEVNDGHLHRFGYTAEDGTKMRYIVIRKGEGSYGVGLDACDVCGPSGYYERDGQIVCILCDVVMNISTIGFKGGCNPVPLEYELEDGRLIIKTADLEAESHRFR